MKRRVLKIYDILHKKYKHKDGTALIHNSPFELLVATILSSQCTDKRVNMVTPKLFKRFPTPEKLAVADILEVEKIIKSTGFYRNKAKNLVNCAGMLVKDFNGEVPSTLEDLIKLPGVGRKTANVVLGHAFNKPGITVDTHVKRISKRLGFTKFDDPVKIEMDLMTLWPKRIWTRFSDYIIYHGRDTCKARKPGCDRCEISHLCSMA